MPFPCTILLLLLVVNSDASGFMQWSRSMTNGVGTYTNSLASVAGINVINFVPFGQGGQARTDVVNSNTGVPILSPSQPTYSDTSVVITPAEDSNGLYTCMPLYRNAGEGNAATQPTWCGILQLNSNNSSSVAHILFPNGSSIPLIASDPLGHYLPWRCSNELPCVIRTQELRDEQLGGCHRQKNSSGASGQANLTPSRPPQSTHVTLVWNNTLFLFRPLLVAAASTPSQALALITQLPAPVWTNVPEQVDNLFQYLTIAYPVLNGWTTAQGVVCALAIIEESGNVKLFDSDRDDGQGNSNSASVTDLMPLVNIDPSDPNMQLCAPTIESVLKRRPCAQSSNCSEVGPPVYDTSLAVTCTLTGVGTLFDFIINWTDSNFSTSVYSSGRFDIPSAFNASESGIKKSFQTDISMTLIQPTITNPDQTTSRSQYFSYSVSIAFSRVLRYQLTDAGALWDSPPFATLVFTSGIGSSSNPNPLLTSNLIGKSTFTRFDTVLYQSELQTVVNAIGWVATLKIPADIYLSTDIFDDPVKMAFAMSEALTKMTRWVAADGTAYSVLTEGLFLFVNATSGALAQPEDFYQDANGFGHGGVRASPQTRANSFITSRSVAPLLTWASPAQNEGQPALLSTYVLVTSPLAKGFAQPNTSVFLYSLSMGSGLCSSMLHIQTAKSFNGSSIWWVPNPANDALFSAYTQSFAESIDPRFSTNISVVLSDEMVNLVSQYSNNASHSTCTIMSIPFRSVAASTRRVSYALNLPPLTDYEGAVAALNPVGSSITFVCAVDYVFAYNTAVGNVTWKYYLGDLDDACVCQPDNSMITLSADQKYLFIQLAVQLPAAPNVPAVGIMCLFATTGRLFSYYGPENLNSDNKCADVPSIDGILPCALSPMTEITSQLGGDLSGYEIDFAGVVTVLNTRCFLYIAVTCEAQGPCNFNISNDVNHRSDVKSVIPGSGEHIGQSLPRLVNSSSPVPNAVLTGFPAYLLGIRAKLSAEIVVQGDVLVLTDTSPQIEQKVAGPTALFFSISQVYETLSTSQNFPPWGIMPSYAIDNVLDSVFVDPLWLAVTLQTDIDQTMVYIYLTAYSIELQLIALNGQGVANYELDDPGFSDKMSLVSLFLLPRSQRPVVCVAASNITCFQAERALSDEVTLNGEGDVEYFGSPAIGDNGIMVFAQEGWPCTSVSYAESESGPAVLWAQPTWEGQDDGVDMNIDVRTCNEAIATLGGVFIMCYSNAPDDYSKHMYLLSLQTGRVLLASGPSALEGSVTISSDGQRITYVDEHYSAITVEFVVGPGLEPVTLSASFCLIEPDTLNPNSNANYHLQFTNTSITATRTPWNVSEPMASVTITELNTTAIPLMTKAFTGAFDLRLGSAFTIVDSEEIIALLGTALPPSIIQTGSFNFILGETTILTNSDFSLQLSMAGTCIYCNTFSCPELCGINVFTGDQYVYSMATATNSFVLNIMRLGTTIFNFNTTVSVPFCGNSTLVVDRLSSEIADMIQVTVYNNYDIPTTVATSGRFCMAVPQLSGQQYVVLEIATEGKFASMTSYSLPWGAQFYTGTQAFQNYPVWSWEPIAPTIQLMLNSLFSKAIRSGAFPFTFSPALIFNVSLSPDSNSLTVDALDGSLLAELTVSECEVLDLQIPLCPNTLNVTDLALKGSKTARSVVWKGSPGSNWGNGFVATGFAVRLSDLMRYPSLGRAVNCGGSQSQACPSICQALSDCDSQIASYFRQYLYTSSMLPSGSSATVPGTLPLACKLDGNINSSETMENLSKIQTRFHCSTTNEVVLTVEYQGQEFAMSRFPSGAVDNSMEAVLTCSACTYFMLTGIIAQPFEWIAAGAVKSLFITILFYFALDKIRKNHRFQTRSKKRHRHNVKKLRALERRVEDLQTLTGDPEQSGENEEALYLAQEVERVRIQVKNDEAYEFEKEQSRWYCAKVLPNPIAFYSQIIIALSGIRHPEERSAMLVRMQDSLSTEEVSLEQLIDTLMHITEEAATERQMVQSFTHFYQWNMCLNRQVVVREYIEASAHFMTLDEFKEIENELQRTHAQLREAYILFRLAYYGERKVISRKPDIPNQESDYNPTDRGNGSLRSVASVPSESPSGQNQEIGAQPPADFTPKSSPTATKVPLSSAPHLANSENKYIESARNRFESSDNYRDAASNGPASFLGLDSIQPTSSFIAAPTRQSQRHSPRTTLSVKASSHTLQGEGTSERENMASREDPLLTVKAASAEWDLYRSAFAEEELKNEVAVFIERIHNHPQCFEYVTLPSRSIDDKLMPNTLLIIASIAQCVVVLMVYAIDVVNRGSSKEEGRLSPFDTYQCIFFMVFNSSTPSALFVSAVARADLGSLEHSQTVKSKLRDIFTDPYVVFMLLLFSVPLVTHILPGMFLYGFMTFPPLLLAILVEYLLRTRVSRQTHLIVAIRSLSRVAILFVSAMVLALSYDYSARFIWSSADGYFKSGSYRQTEYTQVIIDDYRARDLGCFIEHLATSVANFLQMGVSLLY